MTDEQTPVAERRDGFSVFANDHQITTFRGNNGEDMVMGCMDTWLERIVEHEELGETFDVRETKSESRIYVGTMDHNTKQIEMHEYEVIFMQPDTDG